MAEIVVMVSLALSVLNWLVFLLITFLNDLPAIERLSRHLSQSADGAETFSLRQPRALDPIEALKETASLARAFKKAGAAPTAAAMSVLCLLIAAIAAGVGKL